MNLSAGVYVMTNIDNGKKYVGCSINVEDRKQQHFNQLKRGVHSNRWLQKDFDNNFEWSVLEYCEKEELKEREDFWINELDTYYSGYNIASKSAHSTLRRSVPSKKEQHVVRFEKVLNGLINQFNGIPKDAFSLLVECRFLLDTSESSLDDLCMILPALCAEVSYGFSGDKLVLGDRMFTGLALTHFNQPYSLYENTHYREEVEIENVVWYNLQPVFGNILSASFSNIEIIILEVVRQFEDISHGIKLDIPLKYRNTTMPDNAVML